MKENWVEESVYEKEKKGKRIWRVKKSENKEQKEKEKWRNKN